MIKIKVSATSANIGAGFDCMGLALDIYNEIIVEPSDIISVETDDDLPKDKKNLVISSMIKAYEKAGKTFTGVKMKQINNIPKASGLGSSAACIVGGVVAANELMGGVMSQKDIINLCTEIDGHPDNVVPAILGGITASAIGSDSNVHTFCTIPDKRLKVAVLIADFELPTVLARKVLPDKYSRSDLVYSLSRAVTTFAALERKEYDKLKYLVDDKIHTPYRRPLIKGYDELEKMLLDNGAISVFLSGAGPTIAAFIDNKFTPFQAPQGWRLEVHDIVDTGYTVIYKQ